MLGVVLRADEPLLLRRDRQKENRALRWRWQLRERSGVEAAQRMRHRLAHGAEDRRPDVDIGRAAPEAGNRAAALIGFADELTSEAHQHPAAQPRRRGLDERALDGRHRLHRPLRRVFARARRDNRVRVAFLPQKAEHGVERRETDRPFPQPLRVQPVLVEAEARRQDVGDALMQARDEHATYTGFTHQSKIVAGN